MKICLFACVFGRPQITKVFAAGVRRLQETFNLEPFVVVSTDEDFELCAELNLNPFMHVNLPLGHKHNAGLTEAFKTPFDSLILLGSDNLISNEAVQMMIDSKLPHVGFRSMIAYETRDGKMLNHTYNKNTRIIGAGRMISRTALKAGKKFGPWEYGINRCLDISLESTLSECGFPSVALESDRIHILDLKSETNINPLGAMKVQAGKVTEYNGDWSWFLNSEEQQMILKLKQ